MTWLEYALWGAFGGLAIEAIEFLGAISRVKGWPWKVKGEIPPFPLAVSVMIRVGLGFGLASAAGQAGEISGPWGAISVGVAAPLLLAQMGKQALPSNNRAPL